MARERDAAIGGRGPAARALDRSWLAALGLLLAWAVPAQAQPKPESLASCMNCHGKGGNSPTATVPSIAAQPRTFIENQLVLIHEGLRDVPEMKGLMANIDDTEIVALAKHFSAQAPMPAALPRRPELANAGAELSRRALCSTCHLPGYVGQNQVPRLAGQQEAYLLATLKMYRDNPAPGRDTLMSAPLQGMKDAELEALAHHMSQQGRP